MTSDDEQVAALAGNARREAERWPHADPTYAELMGTYAELGDLLATGDRDTWFEDDCRSLVNRLIALGKKLDAEMAQQIAAWSARQRVEKEAA